MKIEVENHKTQTHGAWANNYFLRIDGKLYNFPLVVRCIEETTIAPNGNKVNWQFNVYKIFGKEYVLKIKNFQGKLFEVKP